MSFASWFGSRGRLDLDIASLRLLPLPSPFDKMAALLVVEIDVRRSKSASGHHTSREPGAALKLDARDNGEYVQRNERYRETRETRVNRFKFRIRRDALRFLVDRVMNIHGAKA